VIGGEWLEDDARRIVTIRTYPRVGNAREATGEDRRGYDGRVAERDEKGAETKGRKQDSLAASRGDATILAAEKCQKTNLRAI
jgi:hypothetical protein